MSLASASPSLGEVRARTLRSIDGLGGLDGEGEGLRNGMRIIVRSGLEQKIGASESCRALRHVALAVAVEGEVWRGWRLRDYFVEFGRRRRVAVDELAAGA